MEPRLPFDPSRMTGADQRGAGGRREPPAPPSRADTPMRVAELCARIDTAIRAGLEATVRVIGQVSGFSERTHWYFQLKEDGAVVSAVMFASAARRAGFRPQDGAEVVVSGRVEFYAPSGRVSLIVDSITPVGVGALELRFRALCEELRALGWFEEARKRPLPPFPRRVAVVTSRTGAALQDVIDTARRRWPAVELAVVDVRVQGAAAAPEVARALDALSRRHAELGVDAVLLTRGGGSIEDLWAFNERGVAEAIVRSAVPVVAAIGHESDTTIAELVADLRCATPTQAAMRLVPDRAALGEQVGAIARRLRDGLRADLRWQRQRVESLARRPGVARPAIMVEVRRTHAEGVARRLTHAASRHLSRRRTALDRLAFALERHRPAAAHARRAARVDLLADRLRRAGRLAVERARSTAAGLARELEAVGPAQVLARGYSLTTLDSGEVVRSVAQVGPGQRLTTRVADGTFDSSAAGAGRADDVVAPPPPRRRRPRGQAGQMDLFGVGG